MGFPVFPPFFDPTLRCDVYLKTREGLTARQQIEALMAPPLWPIRTDTLSAGVQFHDVEDTFLLGAVTVETMESRHPGGCTIYKISHHGVSVVYATDYEPDSSAPADFCTFAQGCSLLLIDGQYTQEEYAHTQGFGHSTIERSVCLSQTCGAKHTLLFHHDPKRTDQQLLELERTVQSQGPRVHFGRGGEEVIL